MSADGDNLVSFLRDEQWARVSIHAMHLAFLRAEWGNWSSFTRWIDPALIHSPRLQDEGENRLRTCLLFGLRGGLLMRVPSDTEWHLVSWLRTGHLHQLQIISHCGWDDPRDRNELLQVASRNPIALRGERPVWEPPILWGHTKEGPFTILEGNKRLTACASNPATVQRLEMPCIIGLSPTPCCWHRPDGIEPVTP